MERYISSFLENSSLSKLATKRFVKGVNDLISSFNEGAEVELSQANFTDESAMVVLSAIWPSDGIAVYPGAICAGARSGAFRGYASMKLSRSVTRQNVFFAAKQPQMLFSLVQEPSEMKRSEPDKTGSSRVVGTMNWFSYDWIQFWSELAGWFERCLNREQNTLEEEEVRQLTDAINVSRALCEERPQKMSPVDWEGHLFPATAAVVGIMYPSTDCSAALYEAAIYALNQGGSFEVGPALSIQAPTASGYVDCDARLVISGTLTFQKKVPGAIKQRLTAMFDEWRNSQAPWDHTVDELDITRIPWEVMPYTDAAVVWPSEHRGCFA
jgi:hypothetical protein